MWRSPPHPLRPPPGAVNGVLRTVSQFLDLNNQTYLLLKENHLPNSQSMQLLGIRYFKMTNIVTVF